MYTLCLIWAWIVIWSFWNFAYIMFSWVFMRFILDLYLMMLFNSNCYGFLAMLALNCPWFHEKWCEIEYVMLIWKWALNLNVARVFDVQRLKMMWWHFMIGPFEFLSHLNFCFIWYFVWFYFLIKIFLKIMEKLL